ncbi:MAG TPA: hypoxanthine phosphoribosyltransferase [Desulfobulbus sp.]|nr:hypoxanthine phosphoribosyltransferase [Desulfobulbus sp.]
MADKKILINARTIERRVMEIGREIGRDYAGRQLVLLGILNGAFIFMADLARAIDIELEIDFIRVASYGNATSSSGTIRMSKEPELDLAGKDVVLVEDIVDTGTTIAWLRDYFASHDAASVRICALIDKKERRQSEVEVHYRGFTVEGGFLVGYGLDYAEKYRNLPDICTLSP